MPNFKTSRMAEDIKREITAVIRELKDPRVRDAMLTVVRVEIVSDLSYAKVYVSSMQGMDTAKTAAEGLRGAAGYIRRELGTRLRIRKAPELKFIPDDSVRESIELFAKLEKHTPKTEDTSDHED